MEVYASILTGATIGAAALSLAASGAHYRIGLTVAPEHDSLAADTHITLPAVHAGEEVELILGDKYLVTSVTTEPDATVIMALTEKPWSGLQRISIRFAKASTAPSIRVVSQGILGPSGTPPLNSISPHLVELNLDSMWLPIRSDLALRFSADALIAGVPDNAILVAQGDVRRTGPHWQVKRAVEDVDFAFAAAPGLQQIDEGRFEFYAEDPETYEAQLYRRHGAAAVRYFEEWLGPMPGKTARIVLVSRERKSGYARRNYIVFTQGRDAQESGTAKFTAHELSHAWFANANPTTEHRWLDESLAEYVSLRFVEAVLGREQMEALVEPKRAVASQAKPLLGGGLRGDAELYNKGPLLLLDLEKRIGRERLDRLIRIAATDRIGTTARFLENLREVSDLKTSEWFESRLRS